MPPAAAAAKATTSLPTPRPVRLARGEHFEGIIDATIYLHMDSLLGRVDHRLRELLNTGQPIPTYYAYLTHLGYLNWVRLTEDHRYTYYRSSVELCEANAAEIAAEIVRRHRPVRSRLRRPRPGHRLEGPGAGLQPGRRRSPEPAGRSSTTPTTSTRR